MLKHLKILDINGIYDALCFQEDYLENVDTIINIFSTISEENPINYINSSDNYDYLNVKAN